MLERAEYKNGPPSAEFVLALAQDRDHWKRQYADAQATIADLQGQHALANERAKVWETQATNMQAVNAERCTELERAQQRVAQLDGEKQELEQLFDLQHTRTVEADKLWQQAHNRPDLWPDLGQLVGWLMSRYDSLQADHARVLGLVRTACERWRAQTNAQEGISFRMAMKELEASLPAQPAACTRIGGCLKEQGFHCCCEDGTCD